MLMLNVVRKAAAYTDGVPALAGELGITPSAIYMWLQVPHRHVLKIEELTGGEVTRYEMRPDIWQCDGHKRASARVQPADAPQT